MGEEEGINRNRAKREIKEDKKEFKDCVEKLYKLF